MSKQATNPEDASPEVLQERERFRRLHYVLETHPGLSGLRTSEHQQYLRDIWEGAVIDAMATGYGDAGEYPGGEQPDYSKEIGYEEDWT